MRVLHLSLAADTGGQGAGLRAAVTAERPSWRFDQMRRKPTWIGYPAQYDYAPALARRLYRSADVVHLNQSLKGQMMFDPDARIPVVVHHHGTEYRRSGPAIDAACRAVGAVQVAATLDLTGSPGVEWLPSVVNLDALARMRRDVPAPSRRAVQIMHSPTNRAIKSTDVVIATIERLRARGLPVELILVERRPWAECLARKARADIVVDQLTLGYGLNAIEAWAMGIPVVAGTTDPETRRRMIATFGELPFIEATEATLEATIEGLVLDSRLRSEWSERGRSHAERFHSQTAVVARLDGIYRRALAHGPAAPQPEKESTMSAYDQDAFWRARGRTYEAAFRGGPAYEAQEAAIAEVLVGLDLSAAPCVLEVACGFGRISEVIRRALPTSSYLGIDISPELAASAAKRLTGGNAAVRCTSLADLQVPDEPYDLVVVAEYLMHVPPERIGETVALLKRLGRTVVSVDWDQPLAPGRVPAEHNFLHDYRRLFGIGTRRIPVGRQAIYVWRRRAAGKAPAAA